MLTTLIGAIVNIVLDPVFIFGLKKWILRGGGGYGDCTDVIMHLCSLYIEEKDAYSADAGEA